MEIAKNHLGSALRTSRKMNKNIKTKLAMRLLERPLPMYKYSVIPKKMMTA